MDTNTPSLAPQWIPQSETEDDLKRRYAGYLSERPDNDVERMHAARMLFPRQEQVFVAMEIAKSWPHDPIVVAELTRLRSAGHDTNLPTKADIGRRLINIADDTKLGIDYRLKALDKYAEIMGMKPQGSGAPVVIGNVDQRRVFVLPPPQNMNEWEKDTMQQQGALIDGSAKRIG